MKMPLLKRCNGVPSTSLTLCWIFSIFSLLYILVGQVQNILIGTYVFNFRAADSGIVFALLGPVYGLYGFRRLSDNNIANISEDKK